MIARVALDTALDRLFDYAVPPELAPRVRVGVRVRVPFGARASSGYVVECAEHAALPATAGVAVQQGLFGADEAPAAGGGRLRANGG